MTRFFATALVSVTACLSGCTGDVIDEGETGGMTPLGTIDGPGIYASEYGPVDHDAARSLGTLGKGDLTVLMVVDRSGSMGTLWDGSTKWSIARSSLDAAIVGVEEEVTIGALFFPLELECDVPEFSHPGHIQFQSGALFQTELRAFPDALGGGTPMHMALLRAESAVQQAVLDGALEGRLRVILVTDGEPNCTGTDEEMIAITDSWREMGVDVRVMGLPGSEQAARLLDRLAGKEVSETDPYVPPPTVVDTTASGTETGYVAPSSSDDVDDSLHAVVR